uniref:Uncharacterized protein n=1 Tax=Sphaerodactylus townsendi TaxID=933632 RepID=A0ACB8E688_9SAUR
MCLPLSPPLLFKINKMSGIFLANQILFPLPIFYSCLWKEGSGLSHLRLRLTPPTISLTRRQKLLDNLISPGCYLAKPLFIPLFPASGLSFIFSPASIEFCQPLISFSFLFFPCRHMLFMQIRPFHTLPLARDLQLKCDRKAEFAPANSLAQLHINAVPGATGGKKQKSF